MKTLFRIENNKFKTCDIVDYSFEENYFKSEINTYTLDDINAFIIPTDEMLKILGKKTNDIISKPNANKQKM